MSHERQVNPNYNFLKWDQRWEAIREYEKTPKPTVKQLAMKYNVSQVLMRNILHNRELVLKSYEEELLVRRQEKLDLLDKVMYEYVQRAMNSNLWLGEKNMLHKAQEVKDGIDIADFEPTISWLNDFKLKYGITGFYVKALEKTIKPRDMKRSQNLSALDMIAHVILEEKKEELKKRKLSFVERENKIAKVVVETLFKSPEPAVMPENEYELLSRNEKDDAEAATMPENDNELIIKSDKDDTKADTNIFNCPQNIIVANTMGLRLESAVSRMSEIKSVEEALKHLRLLEEFAMLQDNFRAIGLLTQLEQVFKQTLKEEELLGD